MKTDPSADVWIPIKSRFPLRVNQLQAAVNAYLSGGLDYSKTYVKYENNIREVLEFYSSCCFMFIRVFVSNFPTI